MRKHCNFKVPNPFVVLSTRALKRNGYRRYIIYPNLSRFKKACLNCHYRYTKNKESSCILKDPQFMLKFYGIDIDKSKGVFTSLGAVPTDLKPHPLAVKIEAYLNNHRQKPRRILRVKAKNKTLNDRTERRPCFTGKQSKPVV